jgi:hypothetical protein
MCPQVVMGFVSPQYHIVFFSSKPNDVVDAICEDRYKTNRDIYANDNDELMQHREVEIVDMAPTPATQGGPVPVFQFLMVR